jgi:hypothetical protein
MRPNPSRADASDRTVRATQDEFNRTYGDLLTTLDRAFDGHPELFGAGVGLMYQLKAQAQGAHDLGADVRVRPTRWSELT